MCITLRMRLRKFRVYNVLKIVALNAWCVAVVIVSWSFFPYSIFRHEAFRSVFGVEFHDLYIERRVNIWGSGALLICFGYFSWSFEIVIFLGRRFFLVCVIFWMTV